MSRSIRAVVSQKVGNKMVQYNNRLADFANPPITTGNLIVHEDLVVYKNGQVNGNLVVNGTISQNTFLPGQVIGVTMLGNSDLGQSSKTIAAGATNNIFSFTFTPKYSTSYLIIEYQSVYSLGSGGNDFAYAYLNVNDGAGHRISQTFQNWTNSMGGGTRSGVLFPLIGRYTNTNTSSKIITVDLYNATDADPLTVNSDISTWLKITEIGR